MGYGRPWISRIGNEHFFAMITENGLTDEGESTVILQLPIPWPQEYLPRLRAGLKASEYQSWMSKEHADSKVSVTKAEEHGKAMTAHANQGDKMHVKFSEEKPLIIATTHSTPKQGKISFRIKILKRQAYERLNVEMFLQNTNFSTLRSESFRLKIFYFLIKIQKFFTKQHEFLVKPTKKFIFFFRTRRSRLNFCKTFHKILFLKQVNLSSQALDGMAALKIEANTIANKINGHKEALVKTHLKAEALETQILLTQIGTLNRAVEMADGINPIQYRTQQTMLQSSVEMVENVAETILAIFDGKEITKILVVETDAKLTSSILD